MPQPSKFAVVYRFRVRAGDEDRFRRAWARLTEAIRDERGGLGSRLHRADDGTWVAYAQWPDRATWERSRASESADPRASAELAETLEESLPPLLLEPWIDLLEPATVEGPE